MSGRAFPRPPTVPLQDAIDWVRRNVRDGVQCPCCRQFAKVYRRKLHASMACAMVLIARETSRIGGGFFHVPSFLASTGYKGRRIGAGGDWAKLEYWELIEAQPGAQPATAKTSGIWRATNHGQEFAHGRVLVPSHAVIYDGQLIRLDGPYISIHRALGARFDYTELMRS